ncbi:MAG: protein kinase [Candidatus Lokiarchaeota archaeon]|nr:protein kinase [Candidatus Lokiarchaeota archaeon]
MILKLGKIKDSKLICENGKEYEIIDEIDKGGGGNVCLCIDSEDFQFVAKIFSRTKDKEKLDEALKRFINERDIQRKLDHPNIMPAIDIGRCVYDGLELPFYIMPKARENLKDYFKSKNIKEKPLEVKRILNEILEGLIHLHDKLIIHRDIKPKNILVFDDNSIKVADFGMSHFPDEYKKELIQTPSDEFHSNQYYINEKRSSDDPRIDICALGRLIHELLTDSFPGGTNQSISGENGNFDVSFDEIIAKMTKSNINERYQSLKEVKNDLDKYYGKALTKLRNLLDEKIYRILLNLDTELADLFESGILTLKNETHSGKFAQAANSLSFVCRALLQQKDSWISDAQNLPKKSKDLKMSLINELEDVCRFFASISNYDEKTNELEFGERVQNLEELIEGLLKSNIKIISDLDILLNKKDPTIEDVDKLIDLLGNPSHSQYFFSRLKSPKWLDLLIQKDFFIEPSLKSAEPSFMVHIWPQVNYLINISPIRSEKVLKIIENLSNIIDVTIFRSILLCLYNMPVETAKKALPFIKKWTIKYHSIPELVYLKKLINNFIYKNEIDTTFELLNYLFNIKKPAKKDFPIVSDKLSFLLSDYEDIIKKVVDIDKITNEPRFLKLLCNSLIETLNLESHMETEKYQDYSEVWKKNIKKVEGSYMSEDTKNLLTDQIRDYFLLIGSENSELLLNGFKILEDYHWTIFIRMRLFLLNEFSDILSEQINVYFSQKDLFFNDSVWAEYYTLLKNQFSALEDEMKHQIFNWLMEGPDFSKYGVSVEDFTDEEEYHSWKNRRISSWIRRRSDPIKEHLPSELSEIYKNSIQKDGEIRNPQYFRYIESPRFYTGSPLKESEIMNLEIDELISYLKTWNPSMEDFFSSKNGLGVTLSRLISEKIDKLEALLDKLEEIPKEYLSHMINGFISAIRNKKDIDLVDNLRKIISFFNQNKSEFTPLKHLDLIREVNNLLKEVLNIDDLTLSDELIKMIWTTISDFLDMKLEEIDRPQISLHYNDFVNYSINTVRGNIVQTFFSYALYHARRVGQDEKSKMVIEVKETLENLINPKKESVEIIHSILAYNLFNLFYLDEEWTKSKIELIFPIENQDLWKIAWESFISYNYLNQKAYKILEEYYKKAIYEYNDLSFSNKAIEGLASHIILLFVHNLADFKEGSIVHHFFEHSDVKARSRAMWFNLKIWDSYKNTEQQSNILDKLLELWKYRLEKIKNVNPSKIEVFNKELQWYVNLFDKLPIGKDQILILNDILKLTVEKLSSPRLFLLDVIKKYVDITPMEVLKVIELLLKGSENILLVTGNDQKIIDIIDEIIKTKGLDAYKDIIRRIVEELIEKANFEITKAEFYKDLNL